MVLNLVFAFVSTSLDMAVVNGSKHFDARFLFIDLSNQILIAHQSLILHCLPLSNHFPYSQEVLSCSENERRERYEALDAAIAALSSRQRTVCAWGRLAALQAALERLAFALAAAPPSVPPTAAPVQVPA